MEMEINNASAATTRKEEKQKTVDFLNTTDFAERILATNQLFLNENDNENINEKREFNNTNCQELKLISCVDLSQKNANNRGCTSLSRRNGDEATRKQADVTKRFLLDKPGKYSLLFNLEENQSSLNGKDTKATGEGTDSSCKKVSKRVDTYINIFLQVRAVDDTVIKFWVNESKSECGSLNLKQAPDMLDGRAKFCLESCHCPAVVNLQFDERESDESGSAGIPWIGNREKNICSILNHKVLVELRHTPLQTPVNDSDFPVFKQTVPTLLPLRTKGKWFIEEQTQGNRRMPARHVLLRGVNLSGNAKLPMKPKGDTHYTTDFGSLADPKIASEISFVGRPFPLDEAHDHLKRLRGWGFNCLRLLVTWEAIEHSGPGIYDEEYLNYITEIIKLCGKYDLYVFIDPHQDVWSRMSGGSGAPAWTFKIGGLDLRKLEDCEAAFTHNNHDDPARFQKMSWPQNYQRFACMHMFTLFWGGNYFAPSMYVDGGVPVQEYLQTHFINAMMQIVQRVCNMPHVLGFDTFNEPSPGFIGKQLDKYPDPIIPPGPVFTPFDAMVSASGYSRVVSRANSIGLLTGSYLANKSKSSCWLRKNDIWREMKVWEMRGGVPTLLQPDYFVKYRSGQDINFFQDFLRPFMVRYISMIRSVMPRAILFIEGDGFGEKEFVWGKQDPNNVVNATHWYDGFTLFAQRFNSNFSVDVSSKLPVFGKSRIKRMHKRDLEIIVRLPRDTEGEKIDEIPTLIGEFGIPYNMHNKAAYFTRDFTSHVTALSMYYDLFDEMLLHSTQWNYCSDNLNEWGDNWNMEDLSIYSVDQLDLGHDGGRGVCGFSRPYAQYVCGTPLLTRFESDKGTFVHMYHPNARNFLHGNKSFATVIYIPFCHFPGGCCIIEVIGGKHLKYDTDDRSLLYVWADTKVDSGAHIVVNIRKQKDTRRIYQHTISLENHVKLQGHSTSISNLKSIT